MTDTSTDAVEVFIQTVLKEAVLSEGLPRNAEDTQDVYKIIDLLRGLTNERDALRQELDGVLKMIG